MMKLSKRDPSGRRGVRRAVVLMPNGLTLFNLFCGIYAIVLAIRGEIASAPTFIVLGGIADVLDGRVARATGTGSRFGEELDSLVDAISFGFAPALIMYLGMPSRGNWEWLLVFIFTSCAVMRLARFNVEQAGRKKTHFHGLPSPAAGLTLATYWWFKETPLYNQAVILWNQNKAPEAAEKLEAAVKADPNFPEAHYLLGKAYINLGKLPESAKELQEYLRLSPNGANKDDANKTLEMLKPYIK